MPAKTAEGLKEPLKCQHCGHIGYGYDIQPQIDYVGGLGYIKGYYCRDRAKCWERWHKQQLKGKEE